MSFKRRKVSKSTHGHDLEDQVDMDNLQDDNVSEEAYEGEQNVGLAGCLSTRSGCVGHGPPKCSGKVGSAKPDPPSSSKSSRSLKPLAETVKTPNPKTISSKHPRP